jgi:uncharacterized protein YbaR (Trm112 family)
MEIVECPKCKGRLQISNVRLVVENDDTPDVETGVYREQDIACLNKDCEMRGKVVRTVRTKEEITTV